MGLDEDIDQGLENLFYAVKNGWNYLTEWVGSYFRGNNDEKINTSEVCDISVYCNETENCSHKVTLADGSEGMMTLQEILNSRCYIRTSCMYHLLYVCRERGKKPQKKIKSLCRTMQDSDPSTSSVTFADGSEAYLFGPQIYWLCHKYGVDLLDEKDREFLKRGFSRYYRNTDIVDLT